MKFAHYSLAVLLSLGAAPAVANSLTDLFPPDTKVVFGIRVHNLALSSVAQAFAAQARTAAAGWLKVVPLDGIDLLRDIDEVLIATSGKGQNPPAIIVVTGRFDVARLTAGATRYHDVPLLAGESDTNGAIALLADGTALIGDTALVRAAIDQRGGKSKIDTAFNDRITSLRQRYDIWGLGDKPEGMVSSVPGAKMLESIDRFQFGMQLINGLEVNAEIHARSSADNKKLNETFTMLAALFKGQNQSSSASKFDLQVDGGTLRIKVSIPDSELKKAIQAEAAALSPVSIGSTTPVVTTSDASETGPSSEPPAVAPPAQPAPAISADTTPKPLTPKARAGETDTVVFKLPGKK